MGKFLVIVESPTKAKTLNKYLSNDYIVKFCMGHIRDLPKSGMTIQKNIKTSKKQQNKLNTQSTLAKCIGIDPYHGWKAQYELLPGKEKMINELKILAKKSNHIYLATDLDREGEAIAWHLQELIGVDGKRFSRVRFNEITRNAITLAFEKPSTLDMNLVYAQQARRFMDRVIGYMISPLLWKKMFYGLSAGRVQSVAVRLIIDREREINTFLPEEYWELYAYLKTPKVKQLIMQVTHHNDKKFKPINQQQTQVAMSLLKSANYVVLGKENKLTDNKPGAPFTTSTLQQAACTYLGYSVKKTMLLAQRLYEAGYITYIRTDSTNLSKDALNMARRYIKHNFGNKYLPQYPTKYFSKNNTKEAHEAIRPSDINILAEHLNNIESNMQKLYKLIWCQFIASQMTPAQYNSIVLTVVAGEFKLRAYGSILCFDGWTKAMLLPILHKKEEYCILSIIEISQILVLEKLLSGRHFTKPPARYSEASLVKELEKRGIGRPSTYVSIISTIQYRGYVHLNNHFFYANKIGEIVTNRLVKNFKELMNYEFTAYMENSLDQIALNQQEWKIVLDTFFDKLSQQLYVAEQDPQDGGMQPNLMVMTSINCPMCFRKMGIRIASTGIFLSCSGYNLALQERCKSTINLLQESKFLNIMKGEKVERKEVNVLQQACRRCSTCRTVMDSYLIDNKRKLYICGNNPLCNGYEIEQG